MNASVERHVSNMPLDEILPCTDNVIAEKITEVLINLET
ncbi:unnamed protein product [Brassica oleracea var. botrytis]